MKVIMCVYVFRVYRMGKNSDYTIAMCDLVFGERSDNQVTVSGPELDKALFVL